MSERREDNERRMPRGPLRLLLRAPTVLYRWGFGGLLGRTHLLLRHRGRRTGAVRTTVLEVMTFDHSSGQRVVASYWGERSDWWRNVQAGGALEIVTPGGRFVPSVRVLDLDERVGALRKYRTERPLWSRVAARTFSLPEGLEPSALADAAQQLPMIAFAPVTGIHDHR